MKKNCHGCGVGTVILISAAVSAVVTAIAMVGKCLLTCACDEGLCDCTEDESCSCTEKSSQDSASQENG